MTSLMRLTAAWPGPACALIVEQPEFADITIGGLAIRTDLVQLSRLTVDGDEVVTTAVGGLVPIGDLLWPATESGYRLREAYLRHGTTALIDLPELAGHWCDTGVDSW